MIRIGICDDAAQARQQLHTVVTRCLDARTIAHSIYEFSSGEGLLHWFDKHRGELDLVFLDIELPTQNGIAIAKTLYDADPSLLLAFVTGYADYVFDGYAVRALGYVIKPATVEQITPILSHAVARLFQETEQVFICRNAEGLYRIPKSSILYFYSDRRKVTCVTAPRSYPFYSHLDDVAASIGAGFVRIHQRYLVRVAAIARVESNTVVLDGLDGLNKLEETSSSSAVCPVVRLPISRAYQATVLAAIARMALD